MEKSMNIVVIMNDTWRYDHVGAHGNDWIHTPVLDQFAEESTVFERQYCGSFATIPIRHDIWKGRFGNPIHDWGPLDWESLTLPEVLRKSGYVTMLIHDTPHLINYGHIQLIHTRLDYVACFRTLRVRWSFAIFPNLNTNDM